MSAAIGMSKQSKKNGKKLKPRDRAAGRDKARTQQQESVPGMDLSNPRVRETYERCVEQFRKNKAFFARHRKEVDVFLNRYQLRHSQLSIQDDGSINIIYKGKLFYDSNSEDFCKEQVESFFAESSAAIDRVGLQRGYGERPEYLMHRTCYEVLEKSPLFESNARDYSKDGEPQALFLLLGIGSGSILNALLESEEVEICNLVVYEPECDFLYLSMFNIDWEAIYARQEGVSGKSMQLVFGESELSNHGRLVQGIMQTLHPAFTMDAQILRHYLCDEFDTFLDKLFDEKSRFLSLWGWFDDEYIQAKQILQNMENAEFVLKPPANARMDCPIFVIGSGPSLDNGLAAIKKLSDHAIIVSCGSAIKALLAAGVIPDLHVEIESHISTNDHLEEIEDKDQLRDIPLLAAGQLHPGVLRFFNQVLLFAKHWSFGGYLLGDACQKYVHVTPTCTNAALGVFAESGAKNIFLFGVDYGFRNLDEHHASQTVYYDEEISKDKTHSLNFSRRQRGFFPIRDVYGEELLTEYIYNLSRISAQDALRSYPKDLQVYNCGYGAAIDGTRFLEVDEIESAFDFQAHDKKEALSSFLNEYCLPVPRGEAFESTLSGMHRRMHILHQYLKKCHARSISSKGDVIALLLEIAELFAMRIQEEDMSMYILFYSSLRHFHYILYSEAMGIDDEDEFHAYVTFWQEKFAWFLDESVSWLDRDIFSRVLQNEPVKQ